MLYEEKEISLRKDLQAKRNESMHQKAKRNKSRGKSVEKEESGEKAKRRTRRGEEEAGTQTKHRKERVVAQLTESRLCVWIMYKG